MRIAKFVCVALCLIGILAWAIGAPAQVLERGEIRGTTFDQSHAAIPKATVTLSNPSTGYSRMIPSDDSGVFIFAQVPPGEYTLTAEAPNFAKTTVKGIELHVSEVISVDVTMPLKTQSASVTVTAETSTETPAAGITQLINSQSVTNLPLNGRDYRDLAQLTSSAQVVPNLRGGIRLGGQQSDYTGLTIDGGDAYNNFFGEFFGSLETKNFTIPVEAIQEFQVVTNGFAPEFGRSSGGLLNVITKSGTNEVHGEAHYFYRGSKLSTNDALSDPPNITSGNQFGASVGFPIRKDRQFLYVASDFSRQFGPLFTKFCTAPSCTQALLQQATVPAEPGNPTIASFEGGHTQFQNLYTVLGHYDWQITPKNHFSVRGFFTRNHTNGFSSDGQVAVNDAFDVTENFHNAGVNGVFALTTVSGRKANEIRVLVSGETRVRHANSDAVLTTIFDTGNIGRRFFLPINNDQGKLQGQDNFSYSFGKHDMKWGGDVDSFVDRKDSFAGWNAGEYDFLDLHAFGATPADQANNMNVCGYPRCPFTFFQGFSLNGQPIFQAGTIFPAYQTGLGLYWQDKWQVRPRFTITYGVRWDGTWNPQPQTPTPGNLVYIGVGRPGPGGSHLVRPPQRVPNDFDQWGPRIGMAYNVRAGDNPTVIRAAWGLYYAQTPPIFFPTSGGGKTTAIICFNIANTALPQFANSANCAPPGGYPNVFPAQLTPATKALLGPPGITYVDPAFRNPRVSNLTVGVDQQVARDTTVSVSYAFVHSWRLKTGGLVASANWSRNVVLDTADNGKTNCNTSGGVGLLNTNGFDPFGRACLVPFTPLDPTLGVTNALGSFARGNYHEIMASVNKRFSRHFQVFANYTWSRNYDDASSERDTDSFFGPQDPFNINLDYGRNGLDITHQFKAAAVLDLPFGVTVSPTMIAHSGLAFPAYSSSDINGDLDFDQFANNDRPLVVPASGKPFLLPRYPARQPDYFNWDMRIGKDVKFQERYHVQLVADFFNLTNRGNLFSNSKFGGFVPDLLTRIPRPGDFGGTFRLQDQVLVSGSAYTSPAFAAQFGFKFIF